MLETAIKMLFQSVVNWIFCVESKAHSVQSTCHQRLYKYFSKLDYEVFTFGIESGVTI
jgi:hypothetical protein